VHPEQAVHPEQGVHPEQAATGAVRQAVEQGQPRPQFGFFPWLAFFLARSLRLLVRLDTVGQCYSGWTDPR
jgi:hypothetical protein